MERRLNLKKNNIIKIAKNEVFLQIQMPELKNNYYYVSNYGRVWNNKTKKFLTQYKTGDESRCNDYPMYRLHDKSIEKGYIVKKAARLVAEAFVKNPKPNFYDEIHHKNKQRWDSTYNNLMWTNRAEHKLLDMQIQAFYYDFYTGRKRQVKSLEELSQKTNIPLGKLRLIINRNADTDNTIFIDGIYYYLIGIGYDPETNKFTNVNHDNHCMVGFKKVV